jgi:choline-glycine betaine transporter
MSEAIPAIFVVCIMCFLTCFLVSVTSYNMLAYKVDQMTVTENKHESK